MDIDRDTGAKARAREQSPPTMPDLTRPRYGFSHDIDSALTSLARADIAPERITIKSGGPGWRSRRVVEQDPPPGHALTADKDVKLTVGGEGLFYYLPTGMRDGGGEGELGTEELAALFDDPVEKAAYFVRQGGLYFDLRPENGVGCARWIRLFGVVPEDWPREKWGRLVVLLPWLHGIAGTEGGLRLALKTLLDLDLKLVSWVPRVTRLGPGQMSGLGARASQLGVDLVVGDGLDDEATLRLTLGPVTLADYDTYHAGEGARRLEQALRLVLPYHLEYRVDWLVGDDSRAPQLGVAEVNSVLGINSHLGWGLGGSL